MDDNSIILIYQMGKVGSSTVYNTLKNKVGQKRIIHLHFLSETFKNRAKGKERYVRHLQLINEVEKLKSAYPEARVKIISLVREPVGRNLSDLFENPNNYFPEGKNFSNVNVSELIEIFNKKNNYSYTLNWFDHEFKNYTGVDVYNYKFDVRKGFSIINTEEYDILIVRLEDLNSCYKSAFKDFLNINIDRLTMANESSKKQFNDLNREIKNEISFKRSELENVYSSKYATHFYDQNEIETFIKKWSKD